MPSLYKTATPFGMALLRICEGSARAAFHDHPDWGVQESDRAARSVAKRTAGTIAADWPRLSAVAAKAAVVAKPAEQLLTLCGASRGVATGSLARLRPQVPRPESAAGVAFNHAPVRSVALNRARLRGMELAHRAVGAMIAETRSAATAHLISFEEERIRVATLADALRIIRRCIDGEDSPKHQR